MYYQFSHQTFTEWWIFIAVVVLKEKDQGSKSAYFTLNVVPHQWTNWQQHLTAVRHI